MASVVNKAVKKCAKVLDSDLEQIYDSVNYDKIKRSIKPIKTTALNINDCVKNCQETKTGDELLNCSYECNLYKEGISFPIFYEGISSDYKGGSVKKDEMASVDEIDTILDTMDTNLLGGLITGKDSNGKDMIMGKNYIYPMDYSMNIPFTNESINADCLDKNYNRKQRYMYIRGIPRGDIAQEMGWSLNLPNEPIPNKEDWNNLFKKIDKQRLKTILEKLKEECFSFLYDVQTNDSGEWSPLNKLIIAPGCRKYLKKITTPQEYKILSPYISGSLKGLLPSIVEDLVDILPTNLLESSGLLENVDPSDQKCKTVTRELGLARYSKPDLKSFSFETFSNYKNNNHSILIIIICIIVVFLIYFNI